LDGREADNLAIQMHRLPSVAGYAELKYYNAKGQYHINLHTIHLMIKGAMRLSTLALAGNSSGLWDMLKTPISSHLSELPRLSLLRFAEHG
jgi:hypothetical protein